MVFWLCINHFIWKILAPLGIPGGTRGKELEISRCYPLLSMTFRIWKPFCVIKNHIISLMKQPEPQGRNLLTCLAGKRNEVK